MSGAVRWPLAVALSTMLIAGLVAADVEGPGRVVAALWFMLVCTGMAFVPLLPVETPAARLALAVALSVTIDTVVATALLAAGAFSMTNGLVALAAICFAGCAAQAWRWTRGQLVTEVRLY